MNPHAIWIGTCSIAFLAGCSDSTGPRLERLQEALARSTVSLRQSVAAGEASVGGGKGVRAVLLVESDPQYSVGAIGSGILHDIRVSITNGSVISSHVVGTSADPCPGSISLAEAIGIAEARVQGSAVQIQPDDDDQCLREVQVLSGATLWEVKLARDGKVLEVEKSDKDGN